MTKLQYCYRKRVPPEAYDLFAVFARFEYAMKKGGFRQEGSPKASWHKFAAKIPDEFFEEMHNAPQAKVYFCEPPRRLECDGEGVKFPDKPPSAPENTKELFKSVKDARNNLFHGDKFFGDQNNETRCKELVCAALFILNSAYDFARKDKENFAQFIFEMNSV